MRARKIARPNRPPGREPAPASPACAKAPRDLLGLAAQQARADQVPRRLGALQPSGDLGQQRRGQVGDHGRREVGHLLAQVDPRQLQRRPRWRPRLPRAASREAGSWSKARTGPQPSFAAAIASTPDPVPRSVERPAGGALVGEPGQHLDAEPRRRVGAGAEGAAGLDHDVDRPLAGRRPGRAHPHPAGDQQRLVEVLPAVGPVVGHLGGGHLDRVLPRLRGDLAEVGQLALGSVDRELDVVGALLLLEAVRRQRRELGDDQLGLLGTAADREPDQRGSTECAPDPREKALVGGLQVLGLDRLVEAARRARAAPR